MKLTAAKVIPVVFLMAVLSASADAQQGQVLDVKKYTPCRVKIDIDYENTKQDYRKAKAFKDIEISIFRTQSDLTIIETDRGFIRTKDYGPSKTVYFQTAGSSGFTASFPEFKGEHVYCYKASCMDEINKKEN